MSIKNKAKNKLAKHARKIAFKVLKPFLPYILTIGLIFFLICTIIDAVFIQEVQTDSSDLPEEQAQVKEMCIEKSEYLNTCNNLIGNISTNYLLDVDSRETDKLVEWSHLYSIMAFHNMTNGEKINKNLLEKVSKEFESTFIYEPNTVRIETISTDENGNEVVSIREENHYILIESNSIIGHYKYHYEEKVIQNNNSKTIGKVFIAEELIGEKYERLKEYLKSKLMIKEDDLNTDIQIIIQAANGYYEGKENIAWLQADASNANIIQDSSTIIPKGKLIWPIPGYTSISSHFGMRVHPITGAYKLHTGTDVSAPIGARFVAMADGTVIEAGYNNVYGNMVMIDHGEGIVTLYAHGSEILVKINQVVKKNQAVLKVGSTGYSTGPHAHFEIRINGKLVNPENYFKRGGI